MLFKIHGLLNQLRIDYGWSRSVVLLPEGNYYLMVNPCLFLCSFQDLSVLNKKDFTFTLQLNYKIDIYRAFVLVAKH